jgi:hypothetical protein
MPSVAHERKMGGLQAITFCGVSAMSAQQLSDVSANLISAYGDTMRNLVNVYRASGERMAELLEQQWSAAMGQSQTQLSAEARRNAKRAHDVVGSLYHQGLNLSASGATAVFEKMTELASQSVQLASANAAVFDERLGVPALEKLAQAATPVAVLAGHVAQHIQDKSGALAEHIAGTDKPATRPVSAFAKAKARKRSAF